MPCLAAWFLRPEDSGSDSIKAELAEVAACIDVLDKVSLRVKGFVADNVNGRSAHCNKPHRRLARQKGLKH